MRLKLYEKLYVLALGLCFIACKTTQPSEMAGVRQGKNGSYKYTWAVMVKDAKTGGSRAEVFCRIGCNAGLPESPSIEQVRELCAQKESLQSIPAPITAAAQYSALSVGVSQTELDKLVEKIKDPSQVWQSAEKLDLALDALFNQRIAKGDYIDVTKRAPDARCLRPIHGGVLTERENTDARLLALFEKISVKWTALPDKPGQYEWYTLNQEEATQLRALASGVAAMIPEKQSIEFHFLSSEKHPHLKSQYIVRAGGEELFLKWFVWFTDGSQSEIFFGQDPGKK